MTVREFAGERPSTSSIPHVRYARLWKSFVTGVVPTRTADVASWYGAAQHALGQALHEAQMDRVLGDSVTSLQWHEQQTAA